MPATTFRAADDLVDALRGTAALRPVADRGLAGGLRAWLEDGVFERVGAPEPEAVSLSTRDVAGAREDAGPLAWLRGSMVGALLALRVAGVALTDPLERAVEVLRASGRNDALLRTLDALDADERARLAAEVGAHSRVLCDRLATPPPRWAPRCAVRQRVSVAGGALVLRGLVDLALGAPGGERACVCLLDVTTARLDASHETALAYLALLETIRSGEPPLRVAAMSTADGAALVRDVDESLLADGVAAVIAALPVPGSS